MTVTYPYDSDTLQAIDDALNKYNGDDYDSGTNPGGMGNGGHRINFIPSLEGEAIISQATALAAEYADTKATAAANSATAAAGSATTASGAATTATTQAGNAATSATAAAGSATAAAGSATSASGSATSASTSAGTATTKASDAAASATAAATSATNAASSATAAAGSATAAAGSATAAAASATDASDAKDAAEALYGDLSAVDAAVSAAAASQTAAASSASAAATSASAASDSADGAASSATAAATSETNAASSATAAAGSATAASGSATAAAGSASSASTSAGTATTQAGNAATSATNASTSAGSAATSATAAAGSATAAAGSATDASNYAAALSSTSTSSLAIAVASKTFATQTGKQYAAGEFVLAVSHADPTNYMHGQVTSYSAGSLIVDVLNVGGSGTHSDWDISISAPRGPIGPSGSLDFSAITDVTIAYNDHFVFGDVSNSDSTGRTTVAAAVNAAFAQDKTAGGALGTAAQKATGTSGNTVPLLDGANTWSGVQSFTDGDLSLKGSSSGAGVLHAPAAASAYSWTLPASNGNLAGHDIAQTWSAIQSFGDGKLVLNGSSSGALTLKAPAAASAYVATLPAVTGTLAAINFAQSWSAAQTFLNSSGIKILDTDASHTLGIIGGSNLTADRSLTITTGDANRTLDISAANVTITSAGAAILDDADAAAQRTTLGLAAVAASGSAADLSTGTLPDARLSSAATPFGKQAIWIPAAAMIANTTNGPASGSVETSTNKVMISTLDFDTTTQESAQFSIGMPTQWNEGTVTFKAFWSHASTTTNFGVAWDLAGVAVSDADAIDAAFGTVQTVTDTGGTTNTQYVSAESSAITIAGTPAAEDTVYFRLRRAPANGSDTMAIDARLHGIMLYVTTDQGHD